MKKAEFEAKVQEALEAVEFKVNKKETTLVTDTVFQVVSDLVAQGEEVPVGVLGKLTSVEKAARTARNPKTGETIEVPAKNAPKFKPSKQLKEAVL